ncbi:TRAP transporter substrate-binding protein [Aquamicrobium sp. LC103]|uniref:TRAP transporter substrate-binding protein n=1 Tax=Aquamicrobium sp. LC103 TaxID=1120658 RepID=UPI00063EB994|nr:TRAP transporter substrate-binding protein [Aquamicrobium sp. LC103]TKT74414.1 TRAP transporter substrate-binding protein [Aquamicrobium sp. LC103]
MNKIIATAVFSWLAFSVAGPLQAAEITIKAGHTNVTGSIQDKGLQKLRELLEEKTNGKATIEIFPNGQIGDESQLVEGALLGTVDMAMTSNSLLSNFVKDLRVLDMPFMFENVAALSKALEGPAKGMMQNAATASGFQLIGSYSSGIRHLMTKKDINSISDIANLKIRTMQQPMHVQAFRAYGANPTPLAYSELYGALQSGIVDGAEGATSDYDAQRFYEVAQHFSLVGWLNLTAHIFMSERKFASLPEDVQAALLEAGEESAVWQRQYVIEQEQPLLADLKEKGVTIVEPDTTGFREASKDLYDKFLESDSQRALFEALNK